MQPHKQSGFTLIEILIVIALLGVLAAIGIPQYNQYKLKGQMSEATTNVAALVLAEEEFFLENNRYFYDETSNADLAAASGGTWEAVGRNGVVSFAYTVSGSGTTYTIKAEGLAGTPVAGEVVTESN